MSSPTQRTEDVELRHLTQELLRELCDPLTFVKLRRLFLLLVRGHFASSDNYGPYEEMLKCHTYDIGDPDKGTLAVQLLHSFSEESADQKPAVYVGLAEGRFLKLVLNDEISASDDMATTYRAKMAQARLRLICIDRNPDTAMALAESASSFLEGIREPLMEDISLHAFDLVDISDIAAKAPRPEAYYRTDVTFHMQFTFANTLTVESHRLKVMANRLSMEAVAPAG